ncbi:MAG: hypothetical protein HY903_04725 [Deltaproteobacteria bacterium]|nr:hypothetical protein [Deltaproteobacteria bacterium]
MSEHAKSFCQRCLRAFVDLVDGDTPTEFHRRVRKMVAESPKCRACYESYRKTRGLVRQAVSAPRPGGDEQALLRALRRKLKDQG